MTWQQLRPNMDMHVFKGLAETTILFVEYELTVLHYMPSCATHIYRWGIFRCIIWHGILYVYCMKRAHWHYIWNVDTLKESLATCQHNINIVFGAKTDWKSTEKCYYYISQNAQIKGEFLHIWICLKRFYVSTCRIK